jgi:SAM-dependent methyltransferase
MRIGRLEHAVRSCYSKWSSTYSRDYYDSATAYPPVHVNILKKLLAASGARSVLDAGCGPASFLRYLNPRLISVFGFDLTPEMVAEARHVLAKKGVPQERIWGGSVLSPASFRMPGRSRRMAHDAVVCIGVFPHIPDSADRKVIKHLRDCVKPGGLVVVEARNQFFSLFTLNRYSYQFFAEELIGLSTPRGGFPRALRQRVEDGLRDRFRMDLPPVRRGQSGDPGYDEILSRSHNPLLMTKLFLRTGLVDVQTFFYHYHCVPPMFERDLGPHFRRFSVAMEDPQDWRGYFMASAFMVAGKRAPQ